MLRTLKIACFVFVFIFSITAQAQQTTGLLENAGFDSVYIDMPAPWGPWYAHHNTRSGQATYGFTSLLPTNEVSGIDLRMVTLVGNEEGWMDGLWQEVNLDSGHSYLFEAAIYNRESKDIHVRFVVQHYDSTSGEWFNDGLDLDRELRPGLPYPIFESFVSTYSGVTRIQCYFGYEKCTLDLKLIQVYLLSTSTEVQSGSTTPTSFALNQNYPNPFNPETTIQFELPTPESVSLRIYDILGREVRTILNESPATAGKHQLQWDGRDDDGRIMSTGAYFYQLVAGEVRQTRKMVLQK